jgi:Domain of unknown function (DUF4926)
MDRAKWRTSAAFRELLGDLMDDQNPSGNSSPSILDVVALLNDCPAHGLTRGQVGTVVERLDEQSSLIEFSDDEGKAYTIAPCPHSELLVLHYDPQAS